MKPYAKLSSAPLPPPQVNSAVNYVQLPENLMFLSGDRGFKKRYGSLPAASLSVTCPSTSIASGPVMLTSVRTPAWLLNKITATEGSVARYLSSTMTLMFMYDQVYNAGFSSGLHELTKLSAGAVTTPSPFFGRISRAPYTRTDPDYYITYSSGGTPASLSLGTTTAPSSWQTLTETATATGTSLSGTSPSLTASLDSTNTNEDVRDPLPTRAYSTYAFKKPGGYNTGLYGTAAANNGNMSAFSTASGVFIGGGGGAVFYYDGFDVWLAGARDFSNLSALIALNGAGALTGTYKYKYAHRIALCSGETIEGNVSTASTLSPAAQQVQFFVPTLTSDPYSCKTYGTTSTTGASIDTFVVSAAVGVQLAVGQTISLFDSSTRLEDCVITAIVAGGTYSITVNKMLTLAGPTTTITNGSGIVIYRTKAGGDIFYERAEFPCDTGGSFNDNALDATLTVQFVERATLAQQPPYYSHAITEHQGRLCVLSTASGAIFSPDAYPGSLKTIPTAAPPTLWWSSSLSQFAFDPTNSVSFKYTGKDRPTGLMSVNDTLYVFFSSKIYYIQGDLSDPTTYSVHLLDANVGCTDPKSLVQVRDSIYFVSQHGLTELRGTSLNYEAGEEIHSLLGDDAVKDVRCFFWANENSLLVSVNKQFVRKQGSVGGPRFEPSFDDAIFSASQSPTNFYITTEAQTLVYNVEAKRWGIWDIDIYSGVTVNADGELITVDRGTDQLMRSTSDDYTLRLRRFNANCNWTDSGVPFTARYYSEWYDAGVPGLNKSFDRAAIFSTDTKDAGGQGFKLSVRTERDWQPGLTVDQFDDLTDFKVDYGYAEQPYDSQPYGDPELSCLVLPLSNQECKSLRLVLENSEPNRNIAINATAIELAAKFANMKEE